MSLKNVHSVIVTGNTYPNKEAIRLLGGTFDSACKHWVIPVLQHPMNNVKDVKKLEERIRLLGTVGCRLEYRLVAATGSPRDRGFRT